MQNTENHLPEAVKWKTFPEFIEFQKKKLKDKIPPVNVSKPARDSAIRLEEALGWFQSHGLAINENDEESV